APSSLLNEKPDEDAYSHLLPAAGWRAGNPQRLTDPSGLMYFCGFSTPPTVFERSSSDSILSSGGSSFPLGWFSTSFLSCFFFSDMVCSFCIATGRRRVSRTAEPAARDTEKSVLTLPLLPSAVILKRTLLNAQLTCRGGAEALKPEKP